jgi:SH3 domain-containing YSC84-like protein 1
MITRITCSRIAKAVSGIAAAALCSVSFLAQAESPSERLAESAKVFKELAADKSNGLPINLLNKAACVIILPNVKKAAFIVGGQYGQGVMNCRSGATFDGPWSAPIMMRSSGGSFGLQIGGNSTDFVILVMNADGARSVMKGRAKLGADASIAAGPVGGTAEASTTATLQASMLSYSHANGAFAGVSLSGTSLGPGDDDNEKLYGKKVSGEQIFSGSVPAPPSASDLTAALEQTSPKKVVEAAK